ncbi:MAG: hypothetical protein HOC71_19330 [Candidatus Latescibacteria bacterium]|nr:hypothetical protein [Candidatus Latescibacterota bacterium]
MGANIVVFVLSFINNKLIYLFLDEADNGVFFLVMRSSLFLALFMGDWLRLSSMNIAGNDKHIIPVLSANGFWYSVTLGLVLLFSLSLIPPVFEGNVLGFPSRYLPVIFITGIALIARNNWQSLLLVNHRMFFYGLTFVLWVSLFLILDIIFLVIFRFGLNFVVAALVITSVVSALWAFITSIITNGHTFRPSFNVFRMSGKIGVRAWIAVLGMFLMTNIHVFSIKPLTGSSEEGWIMVAMFSVSFRVFALFQRGADVAGTVLYSHIVQRDDSTGYRMTMLVTRNIILVSVGFAVFCALIGKTLILIISSSRYMAAYNPLLLMLPGIIAVNAGSVINNYYWGHTYPLKIICAPFIAALLGLGLNIALVPEIGVSGATLSFSLMSVVWFMYQVAWFVKDSDFKLTEVLVPRLSDVKHVISRINKNVFRG